MGCYYGCLVMKTDFELFCDVEDHVHTQPGIQIFYQIWKQIIWDTATGHLESQTCSQIEEDGYERMRVQIQNHLGESLT
jgi:hypothetical protein